MIHVEKYQYSGNLVYSDDATITLAIGDPLEKENKDELVPVGVSGPGPKGGILSISMGFKIAGAPASYSPEDPFLPQV